MRSQSWTTKLLAGEKLRDTQRDDASDIAAAILSLIWISLMVLSYIRALSISMRIMSIERV
jgi:hypothetical protein